ncbi:MAG: TrkH family potassium uptake protein [Oscillospiraceae bacterium]|nr:TrkH family potassium uptake protein [Oscillospiraceae bacterium]
MNYRMIRYILGWILIFSALFMLVPMITALFFTERAGLAFLLSAGISAALGGLCVLKKPAKTELHARDGFVIVSLSWIVLSLSGSMPFVFSGAIPSFVDALFETVSGYTTTGATILSEVESLPKCVLMWRSFIHWVGGMGVLVFIMAFMQLSGGQNMHLMKAESPGPSVSKLVPRVRTTALILYSIYFVLTLAEFVILLFADMSIFDALNTSFATAGTGGFGIKKSSMGDYSAAIQIIVTVFMILFSINFSSYYLILKGNFKDAFNAEVRWFLIIATVATLIFSVNVTEIYGSFSEALRHSAFTVASIMSTTGFATTDYNLWPELSRSLLVILIFCGACAGSTCGGVKISRIIILFKGIGKELQNLIHPKQVKKIVVDKRPVEHEVVRSVNVYMVCLVMILIFSLLIISFDNHDFTTNFTSVATCLNNVGPGLNLVGPMGNFGFFSPLSKLVLIFDMLAGRLELFPVLLLFSPVTWKK